MSDAALLDIVALGHDVREYGLRTGDLGTIVHVYPPDGVEVEFTDASGATRAVLTLGIRDIRHPNGGAISALNPNAARTTH